MKKQTLREARIIKNIQRMRKLVKLMKGTADDYDIDKLPNDVVLWVGAWWLNGKLKKAKIPVNVFIKKFKEKNNLGKDIWKVLNGKYKIQKGRGVDSLPSLGDMKKGGGSKEKNKNIIKKLKISWRDKDKIMMELLKQHFSDAVKAGKDSGEINEKRYLTRNQLRRIIYSSL